MAGRFAEQMLYLLTIFNCLSYAVVFVLAIVWFRFMLHVVEDALAPTNRSRTASASLAGSEQSKPVAFVEIPIQTRPASQGLSHNKYCA